MNEAAKDKLPQHEKPKRKKPANLTQKSVDWLRAAGASCCNVEKWIPHTHQRKDAFGFGDLLAVDDQPGAILIQVCSIDDSAKRVRKIATECTEAARRWLAAGNRIYIHDWAKQGKAGERKLWRLKQIPVTLADLQESRCA